MTYLVEGIPGDGAWFSAEGGAKDRPTLIRARQDILPLLPVPALSSRIVLSWSCRSPIEAGLPSAEDYEEIASFEETLLSFVEEGAILAFVVTSGGIVEYNFHTSDQDWFIERLNEALSDKPPMPIEISAEDDPDWTEYRALMDAVGLGTDSPKS
jgi:hypothetical protein